MAKFRSNHRREQRGLFSGIFRLFLLLALGIIILLCSKPFIQSLVYKLYPSDQAPDLRSEDLFYLPAPDENPVYHYVGFTLAYQEAYEQARWVAYELNVEHLNLPKVSRSDYFKEDLSIKTGSASFYDYKGSGYTKGHLVPAADRAYSIETMEETFLMSNMTPQTYECNGGIWRELEEQTRDWARSNRSVYIVTGPIFSRMGIQRIGKNRVAVPHSFFKVILDHTEPEIKGIGFIIPNDISDRPLQDYVYTIDAVEEKTGIDFFYELFTDKLEDSIESQVQLEAWPFNKKRYETRLNQWNKR